MVPRIVARRVLSDRPPSWADLLTQGAVGAEPRPAFGADRRLQTECRVVLQRLPARERAAFGAALTDELRGDRHPPHALGLAVEAAARCGLSGSARCHARRSPPEAVVSAPAAARYEDFDVERDYTRLRGPLLGLLRRDGWAITDDEWDAAWNAVCANVWRRQQEAAIDFRGEPLNYLLAAAKNELRRERRRARLDVVSLDADDAPEPSAAGPELDDELDLRDKLRIAQTIARNRLRPRELRVWALRVVCGLTYEEGADRLGMAPKRFEKELLTAHAKIADEIRAVARGRGASRPRARRCCGRTRRACSIPAARRCARSASTPARARRAGGR